MDISQRFSRFIAHLRPSSEQLADAERQAAFLKESLTERIKADGQFHIEKICLSGSAAKHTNLARMGKGTFDIDLGVYFRKQGQKDEQLGKLLHYLRVQVPKIYPAEKSDLDFYEGTNAVNIMFRTSGLKIDVVPIIRAHLPHMPRLKNSGWIPRQDEWRLTSITAHIRFIHIRTAASKQIPGPVKFNNLVRLMKWWNRRLPENLKQCSYFCELITAAAVENNAIASEWQSSFHQVFAFLARHAFSQPIIFHDYYNPNHMKPYHDLVVVLDAVNAQNNLAHKWTKAVKRDYLRCVEQTLQQIEQARRCERQGDEQGAVDAWCQVLGHEFQLWSTQPARKRRE